MRNGRLVGLILGVLFGLVIGACQEQPVPPPMVVADCNPVTVTLGALEEGATLQGPVHSLYAVGDWLYVGLGDSFAVVDGSDGAEPVVVGAVGLDRFSGVAYSNFTVQEGLAYFSWAGADYTIDVRNPREPVWVSCSSAVPWPGAASAFGGRYFISNSALGGIRIEERPLNQPKPVEVAFFSTNTLPEIVWQQGRGQMVPLPAVKAGEPMYVRSYTFDERYLYLLNVIRIPGDYCCGRLTIVDLENPAEPGHLSTTELPVELAPFAVRVAGEVLFINYVEPRGYNPTTVMYDIENRGRPVEMTAVPGFALPVVDGGFAYFGDGSGIDIWELNGDEGPELVGKIDLAGLTDSVSVVGRGRMAFVGEMIYFAAGDRVVVLNNEDRSNPYFVGEMGFPLKGGE